MSFIITLLIILGVGTICGLLGSYAGADGTSKNWRRIGIPAVLGTTLTLALFPLGLVASLLGASCAAVYVALTLGYGIPGPDDEGSDLGRFWFNIFQGDLFWTNVGVRATVGLIYSLGCIGLLWVAPILAMILAYICIIAIWVVFGAIVSNEPMFTFLGKECLVEEFVIHGGCVIAVLCGSLVPQLLLLGGI